MFQQCFDNDEEINLLKQKLVAANIIKSITTKIQQCQLIENIFNSTLKDIKTILAVNRVIIYRFKTDWTAIVVAEACENNYISLLDKIVWQEEFLIDYLELYRQGNFQAITDIYNHNLNSFHIKWLEKRQIRAKLMIPILKNGELWGLLAVHSCSHPRHWQVWEIDLLQHISLLLSIALHQNELYRELEIAKQELEELVFQDELTKIGNRRGFNNKIQAEWERLTKEEQALSLIICDLDYFKQYNDTYGHVQGDHCLKEVANIIVQSIRISLDSAFRYGGEEFAIILPNTSLVDAIYVANRIKLQLRQSKLEHNGSLIDNYITFSFGVSTIFPSLQLNYQTLVKEADRALYQAKQKGRNRIDCISLDNLIDSK